jgi:hypothetical protein
LGHSRVPQSLIFDVVKIIYEGSKLYYPKVDKPTMCNENIDEYYQPFDDLEIPCCRQILKNIESVPISITPVEREKFAYACLECLFELCSDEKDGNYSI